MRREENKKKRKENRPGENILAAVEKEKKVLKRVYVCKIEP